MAKVTNAEYAHNEISFNKACTRVGINPTKRQASKYRRGYGKACHWDLWTLPWRVLCPIYKIL